MKEQPLVSICIPTYNSSKTIIETLQSIMEQTYDNIEIIVGDNNSSDDTTLKVMALKCKIGIKIFKNKENIGPAANNNELIKRAKGKYICIFHADDIYLPTIIEEQVKIMEMFSKCGAVFTLRQIIDENGKVLKKISLPFKLLIGFTYGPKELFFPRMLQYGNIFVCPTAMVRKEVYKKVGLYKTSENFDSKNYTDETQMVIDQDMWLRIMEKYRMCIIDKYLINYRVHLNQGSMVINKRRKMISPEYTLYDKYIDKWKVNDIVLIGRYKKMKSKAYLFYAINSLLDNDRKQFDWNMNYSYFHCYLLSFPFGIIRDIINIFPNFFMRYIILSTVKLLRLMRLNRKYIFLNYI